MIPTTYEELLELYNLQSNRRSVLMDMFVALEVKHEELEEETKELRSLCLSQESENHNLYNENVELGKKLEQTEARYESALAEKEKYEQVVRDIYPGLVTE